MWAALAAVAALALTAAGALVAFGAGALYESDDRSWGLFAWAAAAMLACGLGLAAVAGGLAL